MPIVSSLLVQLGLKHAFLFLTVEEIKRLACHNEHGYLYILSVLDCISNDERCRGTGGQAMQRIAQELHRELVSRGKGRQAELYSVAVSGGTRHAEACSALTSMLGTRKSNPSDISILYKLYTGDAGQRPPAMLMQHPAFLDILVQVSSSSRFPLGRCPVSLLVFLHFSPLCDLSYTRSAIVRELWTFVVL